MGDPHNPIQDYVEKNGGFALFLVLVVGWQCYFLCKIAQKNQHQFTAPMMLEFITLINFPIMELVMIMATLNNFFPINSNYCVCVNSGIYFLR